MNFQPSTRLSIALASLALLPFAAHAVQDCELNGQSINTANGNTTAGKTGLIRCIDRDTGELQREQELRDGIFMGVVRSFEKGKLTREHSVNANGNMDGHAREFGPNGQVMREANYVNGSAVGLARSFYPGGQLRRASFHEEKGGERASADFTERGQLSLLRCGDKPMLSPAVDDAKLCGFSGNAASNVELFDAKGTLRSRLNYVAGKRVRGESLHDNGQPSVQEEVAGNQRTERRFSPEGVKRREIVSLLVDRGAQRQRELEYSERGTLVREQRWNAAGEVLSDEAFYLNGQPRSKSTYTGDGLARVAEVVEFYDNGQRSSVGRYSAVPRGRQLAIGTHQRFSINGTLVSEMIYDDKGRTMRERDWDDGGRLQRDDEVFEDGSRKAYTK